MFISIIVPAFNVESYIERCIDSLCNQSFPKELYEIIIVNDGSTDNTLNRINDLVSKYNSHNIIIIDKPNGGLSSARNAGMSRACGQYVWFVDSDDYIADNCLQSIKNDILSFNNLDVLLFNTDYIYDNKDSELNNRRLTPNKYILGSELFLQDFRYPYSGVQFSIYRKSYLDSINIDFKQGILFEDILYTTLLLASDPKCIFIDNVYYHYYIRSGSISNSNSSVKKCNDILTVTDELYNKIKYDNKYSKTVLYDQIARMLAAIYRYRLNGLTFKEKNEVIKTINTKTYWAEAIISSKKYKYIPYLTLNYVLQPIVVILEKYNII